MCDISLTIQAFPTISRSKRHRPGPLDGRAEEVRPWWAERGRPPLRLKQIRGWLIARRAESFEQMSDLPKGLRAELAEAFQPFSTRIEKHLIAADDTHKLLM